VEKKATKEVPPEKTEKKKLRRKSPSREKEKGTSEEKAEEEKQAAPLEGQHHGEVEAGIPEIVEESSRGGDRERQAQPGEGGHLRAAKSGRQGQKIIRGLGKPAGK